MEASGRARLIVLASIAVVAASAMPETSGRKEAPFDLLVVNARVLDGTGSPSRPADVGIRQGRIERIGELSGAPAGRRIDAGGRILAPGFLDVHLHAEDGLPDRPDTENLIADGVTTIVTGNCGGSELPLSPWFARLEASGVAVNVASLVGHNSVRPVVMGFAGRKPSAVELSYMESLVRGAMLDGALGFSSGLIYAPGMFAAVPELAALARVAGESGGIYVTHMRNENDRVLEAIEEAIAVAREAQVPLQISHFKVTSPRLWGRSAAMLARVEAERAKGLDVTLDQYPYTASSSGLAVMLPDWALESGRGSARAALAKRLDRRRVRDRIVADMLRRIHHELGRDHLDYAVVASAPWDPAIEGKTIREINLGIRERNGRWRRDLLRDEIETVLDLCRRGERARLEGTSVCATQMVYHNMSEEDVERILASPLTMVARDGGIPRAGAGRPHPRSYGTSARVLARYVRQRRALSLEDAVRKMTSLPARRFGIPDRGIVREGFRADLVLFDPAVVEDLATFEEPHRLSRGFDDVIVNGVLVREGGRPTGARPGTILRGQGLGHHGRTPSSAARSLRPFDEGLPAFPR